MVTADYEVRDDVRYQLQHWSVCQVCGDIIPRGSSPDWIDAPRRLPKTRRTRLVEPDGTGWRIIRCPRHWSEWALRNSIGRSNANRLKMRELQERYAGVMDIDPVFKPFPVSDKAITDQPTIQKGGRYGF